MGRRRFLGLGVSLGSAVVLASTGGCTVTDPRIASSGPTSSAHPTPTPSPSPTPTPAGLLQAREAEQGLADLARSILAGRHRGDLDASQRGVLGTAELVHQQHVAALDSPEPTSRPLPTATPRARRPSGLDQLDLDESLDLLVDRERTQARRLRAAALGASGFEALLWGSMSVAAGTLALGLADTRDIPKTPEATSRRATAAVSDLEAQQAMVRQLHAMVYGYQLALGQLSRTSAGGRRALGSLGAYRQLRDDLTQALLAKSADVPAAAGAYVPPVDPTSPARSARLVRTLETALQPFCGLWLASATKPADRELALDTLTRAAETARSWDAPLPVWPGWEG